MKTLIWVLSLDISLLLGGVTSANAHAAPTKVVHVFVSLADNQYQGIVPIPAKLGDGDNPAQNLYWGAAYGMKHFFTKKAEAWENIGCLNSPYDTVLERCFFKLKKSDYFCKVF